MTRTTPFFRFLDLPKEIRFIVYENLGISKTQFRIDGTDSTNGSGLQQPSLVLTTQTLPVQLLATCRLIHSEAHLFFAPRLAKLKQHIPKIRVDAEFLDTATYNAIANSLGMVLASLNHLQKTQESASLELQAQIPSPTLYKDRILRKWILQTSTLLAFQAQSSTPPLLDFFADTTLNYVRICLDVPKRWHSLSTHPPAQCTSSSVKLAELMSETLNSARKRGLSRIRSAAVIYAQEEKGRMLDERQLCAFDYGVKRK